MNNPTPPDPTEGLLAQLDKLDTAPQNGTVAPADPSPPPKPEPDEAPKSALLDDVSDEPAPKPAAKDDDTPAGLTEKSKAEFIAMREALKVAKKDFNSEHVENIKLQKRIAELEPIAGEVEAMRKQLEEYEQRLTVTALEQHPKFRQYFDGRRNTLIETAKSVGGDKVANLLQLPEGEHRNALLKEAYADLDPVAQSQMGAVMVQLSSLDRERAAELAKSREGWKQLQAEEQNRRKAEAEQANRILESHIERWSDPEKGNPMFQPRAEDKDWNTAVERRKELARHIYSGQMTPQDLARAATWAAAGADMAKELNGAHKRIAELKAEVDSLKAAKPGLGGSTGAPVSDDDDGNMSWTDAVVRRLEKR